MVFQIFYLLSSNMSNIITNFGTDNILIGIGILILILLSLKVLKNKKQVIQTKFFIFIRQYKEESIAGFIMFFLSSSIVILQNLKLGSMDSFFKFTELQIGSLATIIFGISAGILSLMGLVAIFVSMNSQHKIQKVREIYWDML
ncbi:hypothetical protein [Bacillus cereus]|uniref:hypothetical protein n=1 Tax=Bacillus cereus TaxID=1396 RepID=UPI000BF25AAA|nr:hypothetical protein [Bacillus cereus]PFU24520.1 hypothetical protein COK76_15475 [Bacillus cereus]